MIELTPPRVLFSNIYSGYSSLFSFYIVPIYTVYSPRFLFIFSPRLFALFENIICIYKHMCVTYVYVCIKSCGVSENIKTCNLTSFNKLVENFPEHLYIL